MSLFFFRGKKKRGWPTWGQPGKVGRLEVGQPRRLASVPQPHPNLRLTNVPPNLPLWPPVCVSTFVETPDGGDMPERGVCIS
ncbi:unnamed protein product [Pylaiella littoralis]